MKNWILFQDLETRYFTLRRQFETGQITALQLSVAVQRLRIQDEHGDWWYIRPEDGTWLHWDGAFWETATPPHLTGPQTLVELLHALIKELFKGLLWKLPMSIGVALVVWATHTVLIVGVNDGLIPGKNALLDMVLALPGQLAPGILFWSVLACLASVILVRVFELGIKQLLQYMTTTPAWVEYTLSSSEGNVIISLLIGCAFALFLGVFVGNRLVNFLLVIVALGALISQDKSLILWALRLAWSDGLRLLNHPPRPFIPAWGGLILLGVVFGFMGVVVLPFMPYTGCVGIFLLVGMVTLLVLVRQGNRSPRIWSLLMPLLVFTLPSQAEQTTFSELWIVIAYGILPAWGALCGTLVGLSLGKWERSSPQIETSRADPALHKMVQPQANSVPAPVGPLAQPPSPQSLGNWVVLQGQPALDVLARLGMIKRVPAPQGSGYLPVELEPQGPVSAVAYFLDEQGYLLPQLAIAYSPPTPVQEPDELAMQPDMDEGQ